MFCQHILDLIEQDRLWLGLRSVEDTHKKLFYPPFLPISRSLAYTADDTAVR